MGCCFTKFGVKRLKLDYMHKQCLLVKNTNQRLKDDVQVNDLMLIERVMQKQLLTAIKCTLLQSSALILAMYCCAFVPLCHFKSFAILIGSPILF